MQTHASHSPTLGDLVAASYDLGETVTRDSTTAGRLAARHLARLLARGSNLPLTVALSRLARELGPTKVPASTVRVLAFAAVR